MNNFVFANFYELKSLIYSIHHSIEADWRKIAREFDLTETQYYMVWTIYFNPNATLSQLAGHCLWNISTVMRVVDNLSKKNITHKYIEASDSRIRRVILTEKGKIIIGMSKNKIHSLNNFSKLMQKDVNFNEIYDLAEQILGKELVNNIKNNAEHIRKEFK